MTDPARIAAQAWDEVKSALKCSNGFGHYCPNCDNSLHHVAGLIDRARAADLAIAPQAQGWQPDDEAPIPLNQYQIKAVQEWASNDEHWGSRSVTEFNLFTFARVILKLHQPKEFRMNIPSIGRIVHYRLSADDAAQINRRRTTGGSIAERMLWGHAGKHSEAVPAQSFDGSTRAWPAGAQAHIGNEVKEGDTFPMLIVRTWGDTESSAVNGQAFLDGTDVLWVTSVSVGEGPRTFSWPTRA